MAAGARRVLGVAFLGGPLGSHGGMGGQTRQLGPIGVAEEKVDTSHEATQLFSVMTYFLPTLEVSPNPTFDVL